MSNQTGLEAESDPFDGAGSCTLVPEATQGPYWVDGEYVRKDIHEDQAGLYTYVDLELIDYTTCETVAADIFVDIWHCNATGVYSGVVASGNGDSGVGENLVSEGWYCLTINCVYLSRTRLSFVAFSLPPREAMCSSKPSSQVGGRLFWTYVSLTVHNRGITLAEPHTSTSSHTETGRLSIMGHSRPAVTATLVSYLHSFPDSRSFI